MDDTTETETGPQPTRPDPGLRRDEQPRPARSYLIIVIAALVGLAAGFGGGVLGSSLHPGKDGKVGKTGVQGPVGPAGKTGPAGATGKAGAAAAAPGAQGICYSTQDGSSNGVYFLTGTYIVSPTKNADGTTSCPDGTYVSVTPQAEVPIGD